MLQLQSILNSQYSVHIAKHETPVGCWSIAINPPEGIKVTSNQPETTMSTHKGDNRIDIPSIIATSLNSNVIKVSQCHTAGEFEVTSKGEFPEVSLVFLVVISR